MSEVKESLFNQADWLEQYGDIEAAQDIRHCPWEIGQNYYFRLATYAWVGRVEFVGPKEIILEDASYIFDCGRVMNMVNEGLEAQPQSEIEPVGKAIIGRGALVDSWPYNHSLPSEQK